MELVEKGGKKKEGHLSSLSRQAMEQEGGEKGLLAHSRRQSRGESKRTVIQFFWLIGLKEKKKGGKE